MKTFFKRVFLGLAALIVIAGMAILYVLNSGGAFRAIENRFAGSCAPLPLAASAEDITVDRERGFAYLSWLDRQALIDGKGAQGTVMRVDLNQPALVAVPALIDPPAHFRPHGLSLWIDVSGQRYLFSLNHPLKRGEEPELAEIFKETEPGRFAHQETITSPLFNSPNDMAAVGPRQFYVANDKVMGGGVAAALQQFGIGGSPLTYYDGREARVVADDIASGGGINVSADGRTLYVSETSGQRIRVLARDPATGAVTEQARIPVPQSPDNIDVGADGSLTVTGHANTLKLIRHFISKGKSPAPSEVLRVIPDNGGTAAVDVLYMNDGTQISASSVGATYGNKLLIGSITARQMLVCTAG